MLLTTEAQIKWNFYNKQHYIDKGYTFTKYGDFFNVLLKDLKGSPTLNLIVQCDYCSNEYREGILSDYHRKRNTFKEKGIISDACPDCAPIKRRYSVLMKYGKSVAKDMLNFYMKRGIKTTLSGVYYFYISEADKYYVGSSTDLLNRFSGHYSALKNNAHESRVIQKDYNINKNVEFHIVEMIEDNSNLARMELATIKLFLKEGKCLYNQRKEDVDSNTGVKWTEESKSRSSNSKLGKKLSEETKRKMSVSQTGRKHSEETKKKLSLVRQGEGTGTAKLNDKKVEEIKLEIILNKRNLTEIAESYGVSNSSISSIKRCETWVHIRPDLNEPLKNTVLKQNKTGSSNPDSKLTEVQVTKIKLLLKENGRTMASIAREYGVSGTLISHIKHGRLWKHVS